MRILLLGLLTLGACAAQVSEAPAPLTPGEYGFFVIGPDSLGVRPWATQWISENLDSSRIDERVRQWPAHSILLELLDTHVIEKSEPPAPPGPSASELAAPGRLYPWDLRTEMNAHEQTQLRRMARMRSLVQVVIEFEPRQYRLKVIEATDSNSAGVVRFDIVDPSLRIACRRVAQAITSAWNSDVRAGTR